MDFLLEEELELVRAYNYLLGEYNNMSDEELRLLKRQGMDLEKELLSLEQRLKRRQLFTIWEE